MKRILSFLTAAVMLLSLSVVGVSAAPEDFQYTVNEGAATVTAYTGSGGDVQMDETLGGVPVTAVVYSAFNAKMCIRDRSCSVTPSLSATCFTSLKNISSAYRSISAR